MNFKLPSIHHLTNQNKKVSDDNPTKYIHVLKGYACGGQKSVFECFLTGRERQALMMEMRGVLDVQADRFLLLPLPGYRRARALGVAIRPSDPDFYYVG